MFTNIKKGVIYRHYNNNKNMKKEDNLLISEKFDVDPSEFGELVVALAGDDENDELWGDFYDMFLNKVFYTAAVKEGEDEFRLLVKDEEGTDNYVLFESVERLEAFNAEVKKRYGMEDELVISEYTGYQFVTSLEEAELEFDVHVDFGKESMLVVESDTIKFLKEESIDE